MNEQTDPYAQLARYYDAENAGYEDDIPACMMLVERFGGPVLDAGCGTGRVVFPLVEEMEVRVVGVDVSRPMLDIARRESQARGLSAEQAEWVESPLESLTLEERFGLAIFPYNGFMHLLDRETQRAVLQSFVRHLQPEGALVLDVANPIELFRADDDTSLALERTFTDPQTGHRVMQQSLMSIDRAAQLMDVTWYYDRIGAEGQVFRSIVPMQFRLTFAPEMCLLLEQAGLARIELYGDYDFNPYEEESPRLLIVAQRA